MTLSEKTSEEKSGNFQNRTEVTIFRLTLEFQLHVQNLSAILLVTTGTGVTSFSTRSRSRQAVKIFFRAGKNPRRQVHDLIGQRKSRPKIIFTNKIITSMLHLYFMDYDGKPSF